jgi:hypothetical protein
VNLALYHYAGNNPVKYTDPTGDEVKSLRIYDGSTIRVFLSVDGIKVAIDSNNVDIRLVITRAKEKADMNDRASLFVNGVQVASFSRVQSEKNYRSGNQTNAERWDADLSNPDFPNITLPVGQYEATLTSGEGSQYDKPLSITSSDIQLPGLSTKGVKASYGFLVHSWSSKTKIRSAAWSWGCQIISDNDKTKLDEILYAAGKRSGDKIKIDIRQE